MLEVLTQKLTKIFQGLASKGKLSEKDIDTALREVRLSLLEADVNFKVVKEFLSIVRERTISTEVSQSLTPAQQVIKIVYEELIGILGHEPSKLVSIVPSPQQLLCLLDYKAPAKPRRQLS